MAPFSSLNVKDVENLSFRVPVTCALQVLLQYLQSASELSTKPRDRTDGPCLADGLTGSLGQHCAAELLRHGYGVIGTARLRARDEASRLRWPVSQASCAGRVIPKCLRGGRRAFFLDSSDRSIAKCGACCRFCERPRPTTTARRLRCCIGADDYGDLVDRQGSSPFGVIDQHSGTYQTHLTPIRKW